VATRFLSSIGVAELPALTSPFDPGYDPVTVESHLQQSAAMMASLKISMACWIIAEEESTRRKIRAARKYGVPTVTGGGPFEIAADRGELRAFLDLCADYDVDRIEAGSGFTEMSVPPGQVVAMAQEVGLEVQFELGKKHEGPFTEETFGAFVDEGRRWLDAGAKQLVLEARESAQGVGLFDDEGRFNTALAIRFEEAFGMDRVVFEAPTKASQFALLDELGPLVRLSNVRLEELLRVEIYRRGIHSDAYLSPKLRPPDRRPSEAAGPR
jgi:phosphosulfolactate synthase